MDVAIRRALPGDAEALSAIAYSAKAYWGYPEQWMEIWEPEFNFPPRYFDENESWAAEADGKPIAFYTLQEKNGNAWVENLWVRPDRIGYGIGKQLFLHAVDRSRLMGYLILQLEADPNAEGFYEKMGMQKVGEKVSEIDGQPRILPIMEMTL